MIAPPDGRSVAARVRAVVPRRRATRAAAGTLILVAAVALTIVAASTLAMAAAGALAAVARGAADDPAAGLAASRVTWRALDFGGQRLTQVSGLVVNEGAAAAGDIEIVAHLRAAPGLPPLRTGTTVALLPELAPGESAPFLLLVGPLEASAVGHVDVTFYAKPAQGTRYRQLEIGTVATRTLLGGPTLFGTLVNEGDAYASASNTNVLAGFWDADGLREVRAATMPILYQPGTTTGQGHPPGVRYPWFLRLPDAPYARVEFWVAARRYADGAWPVPLGIIDVRRDDAGGTVRFAGRLVHCGARPATEFALVSTAFVDGGDVLTFTLTQVSPQRPLPPGADRPIAVSWPGLDPATAADAVSFLPLALDEQPFEPRSMPCLAPGGGVYFGWLPWLGRDFVDRPRGGG
ncbi:MAG: hypothetical protein U0470_08685 [Anaerolineae bacterium]